MKQIIKIILLSLAVSSCTGITTMSKPYNKNSISEFTFEKNADLSYNMLYDSTDFILQIRHVHNTHSNFITPRKITVWLDPSNQHQQYLGIRLGAPSGFKPDGNTSDGEVRSSLYSVELKGEYPENLQKIPGNIISVQKNDFDGLRTYEIRVPLKELTIEKKMPAKIAVGIESFSMQEPPRDKNSGNNHPGRPDGNGPKQGGGMAPPDGKSFPDMPSGPKRGGGGKPGGRLDKEEQEDHAPVWIDVKLF